MATGTISDSDHPIATKPQAPAIRAALADQLIQRLLEAQSIAKLAEASSRAQDDGLLRLAPGAVTYAMCSLGRLIDAAIDAIDDDKDDPESAITSTKGER